VAVSVERAPVSRRARDASLFLVGRLRLRAPSASIDCATRPPPSPSTSAMRSVPALRRHDLLARSRAIVSSSAVCVAVSAALMFAGCGGEARLVVVEPIDGGESAREAGVDATASTEAGGVDARSDDTGNEPGDDATTGPTTRPTFPDAAPPDVSPPRDSGFSDDGESPIGITIVEPMSDACFGDPSGMGPDDGVTVRVSTTGFTLADPGACPVGDTRCGQAWITLDGAVCDLPGSPFAGTIGASGEVLLHLASCRGAAGPHLLRAELRLDDGTMLTPTVDAARTVTFRTPC
jgi:hypothetical protein